MPSLVMTLIGPDRPGLVDSLATIVARHEGNWLESRMAHLAGQFAGIVRVDVPAQEADRLLEALEQLNSQGLKVTAQKDSGPIDSKLSFPIVRLELVGNDRPGILREIMHVLAKQQVNIEELQTECDEAPMTGKSLFRATAELRLPPELSLDQLQDAIEQIALDLMVDVHLAEPSPTE